MANSYSNKWLSATCPNANTFYVNKNYSKYFIFYFPAKKNVVELNDDMKKIKSNVAKLVADIEALKGSIDSENYRKQTESIISALNNSVSAIEANMNSLFNSCVKRLEANAESDAWFGDTAANYARYISESILNRK